MIGDGSEKLGGESGERGGRGGRLGSGERGETREWKDGEGWLEEGYNTKSEEDTRSD